MNEIQRRRLLPAVVAAALVGAGALAVPAAAVVTGDAVSAGAAATSPSATSPSATSPSATSPTAGAPTGPATVLDFEDGTPQGWEAIGKARVKLNTKKPLAGLTSLQVGNLSAVGAAVHVVTPISAWGGSGDWYRLVFLASGSQKATVRPGCGPSQVLVQDARLALSVAGATEVIGSRTYATRKGTAVDVYFRLPASATTADVTVAAVPAAATTMSALLIDEVVLTHGSPTPITYLPSGQPLDDSVAPLCVRTTKKTRS